MSLRSVFLGIALATAAAAFADEHALTVGGYRRSYDVHLPNGRAPAEPAPLVLVFHGAGGNAASAKRTTAMEAKADREGFIAVFPNGSGDPKEGLTWNAWWWGGPPNRGDADDVAFARAIIDDVARGYRVDRKRIFATGFSNGGMLAYRVGCEAADLVAAIAPVAGALNSEKCGNGPKVSVIAFHGTADKLVPYEGGQPPSQWDPHPRKQKSVQFAMDTWTKRDGCEFNRDNERKGGVAHVSYRCPAGIAVELYALEDQGHAWPGSVDEPNSGISATDVMWEFFKAHPKP